jgi:hypothetical protein
MGGNASVCGAEILRRVCRLGVNCTHYRAAALLSASPRLAESIHAAKRFRVVPLAEQVHRSKQRAYWAAFPTSTIRGSRMVNVEPLPGSLAAVMSPPII